jgi:hypothetical protein
VEISALVAVAAALLRVKLLQSTRIIMRGREGRERETYAALEAAADLAGPVHVEVPFGAAARRQCCHVAAELLRM